MKTKTVLLATTALALLTLAAPANAAGPWYVSLTGGANWQDDDGFIATNGPDTLTFASNSDTGYVIAGAVGYSLTSVAPGLRVEAEVSYRDNSNDGVWTTTTGVASDSGLLDFDHSAIAVLANVWYDFDVGGVKPYVGGGLGWADVEVDGTYIGGTIPAIDFSDNGFAWQAGAGINFAISPNMQLGVGYRYFSGPEVNILAPFATNSATSELDYDNHAAVLTLTFGM
jgi:outer membrane autotransporter protein